MAVQLAGAARSERAEQAREARLARATALIADTLVFGAITMVVDSVYGVTQVTSGFSFSRVGGFANYAASTEVAWPWLTLLGLVYFTVSEALFGATPGKLVVRLRVVRVDGQPLDLRSVLIRNVLKPIDYLPVFYLLGGTSVLLTADSQRLGDLAGGTTVVYRHRALEPSATRSAGRAARLALVAALAVAVLLTLAFDYFGRPPLVIQGLFNQHQLIQSDVVAYSIASPTWGAGRVTYPATFTTPTQVCNGSMTLNWNGGGWELTDATYTCKP